jgi:hypothetical protein
VARAIRFSGVNGRGNRVNESHDLRRQQAPIARSSAATAALAYFHGEDDFATTLPLWIGQLPNFRVAETGGSPKYVIEPGWTARGSIGSVMHVHGAS